MTKNRGWKEHMTDEFSAYYEEYLDGSYDCIDRIVLSAYFKLGTSAGGFRTWWNILEGTDENLDNTHLMRMAGRFSRRVRAYVAANGIPVIDWIKVSVNMKLHGAEGLGLLWRRA